VHSGKHGGLVEPRCSFSYQWTTPTIRHQVWVHPEQVTATGPDEWQHAVARVICHWLVDQLPARSYAELLPTLLQMKAFYEAPQPDAAPLKRATFKAIKRVSRAMRPEINLPDQD